MIKRIAILIYFSFLSSFFAFAESNIMFEKANQYYHNKNYQEAANLYQQMIDDGFCDADLFYNAGNAYYRINNIGLSIWNYEKALQLKKCKNYQDNLALAKKRIKEPIPSIKEIFFIRWWKAITTLFTFNGWALVALVTFLLGIFLLIGNKLSARFFSFRGLSYLLFPFSIISLCFMLYQWNINANHYSAIIIEPCVDLGSKITLSEGLKVQYLNKGKQGVWVKLPNDQKVEIKMSSIKKI